MSFHFFGQCVKIKGAYSRYSHFVTNLKPLVSVTAHPTHRLARAHSLSQVSLGKDEVQPGRITSL